jgi:hypothetical protein
MKSILSQRIVNASLEQVFEAYSNPDLLMKWWGPHGFTNKFNAFAFEENGVWDFVMIDEQGKEYHNINIFQTIIPNAKIIAKHVLAPIFEIEIDFLKISEAQTEIKFKMNFEDEVTYNALVNYVPEKNEENFDRLEAIL